MQDVTGIISAPAIKNTMEQPRFYSFLHRQIPVLIVLSVFPGLGYIFLGWLHQAHIPALIWYGLVLVISVWGVWLYRGYSLQQMSLVRLDRWYGQMMLFYYLFFGLWLLIFLIYVRLSDYKLHYIAIFTQIGASTVVAALLYPERRLFKPILPVMIIPLMVYFASIGEWYGYILSLFAGTLGWVLYYSAKGSHSLLLKTHYQASHDLLTGLYNRHYFIEHLQHTMNSLRESSRHSFLLLIDLDHFKTVNDSLGHDVGDRLLQEVCARMLALLPSKRHLARLGGDEFIIIGGQYETVEQCQKQAIDLAEKVLARLKDTYVINDHHIYISASIGVRLVEPNEDNATSLIREADIAMYEVKATGRDGVFLFNEGIAQRVQTYMELERLLHFALRNGEITLNFQPQLDEKRKIVGAEVLVRWNNDKLGYIEPSTFIRIAEQSGIIIELGNYILETAFRTLAEWSGQGITLQQMSINISMRQFTHHSFVQTVRQLSAKHLEAHLCHKVIFEITESVVAEDIDRVIGIMRELGEIGIRFSMDDFGTGYSSLNYLKRLPIDELKIDREFVRDSVNDEDDQAMIITMLSIARFFGLTVVAEGVETEEQFNFLVDYRCQLFQGFYFARPMPRTDFEQYYRAGRESA